MTDWHLQKSFKANCLNIFGGLKLCECSPYDLMEELYISNKNTILCLCPKCAWLLKREMTLSGSHAHFGLTMSSPSSVMHTLDINKEHDFYWKNICLQFILIVHFIGSVIFRNPYSLSCPSVTASQLLQFSTLFDETITGRYVWYSRFHVCREIVNNNFWRHSPII